MFKLVEPEVCEHCGEVYGSTVSLRVYDFCSTKCESDWAELNSQFAFRSKGLFPRIGHLDGEKFTFPANPSALIKELRRAPIDLFTFLQHPAQTGVRHDYYAEADNLAILPISTFDNWFTKQVDTKTRNMARKAGKRGVEVKEVVLDEGLIQGICAINNETPIRQGRKFPHFGMTLDRTREYASTFPTRSIFLGAYLDGKLIGFLKMVMDHGRDYACILHILSLVAHKDKSLNNALIAQAVRSCAERGISQLAYDRFSYGKKEGDSLAEFKVNNGFQRVDVPRYYVSMTVRGAIARRLGLHRKLSEQVPEFIASRFRDLREGWLRRAHQG